MIKHYTSLWALLRDAVMGDPINKQYEAVEEAIKAKAERASAAEFNRTMANFYTSRVGSLDPHTHWWDFADAKQKQYNHQEAFIHNEQQTVEAQAIVDAQTARFHALQEKKHRE